MSLVFLGFFNLAGDGSRNGAISAIGDGDGDGSGDGVGICVIGVIGVIGVSESSCVDFALEI